MPVREPVSYGAGLNSFGVTDNCGTGLQSGFDNQVRGGSTDPYLDL